MKVIKNFSLVDELALPTEVRSALNNELLIPFSGDIKATAEFWNDYDTFLILLEESDVDDTLNADKELQYFIQQVMEYPEFVLLLNDENNPYLLALSVMTSAGGGCYLLAPLSSTTTAVATLSQIL